MRMNRPVLWLLCCVPILAGGCVDGDGPAFYISGHVSASEDCTYEPGNPFWLRGAFNVNVGSGYYAVTPLLNNQLRARGSDAPLRADPNGVLIEGAEVELTDAAGAPIPFGLPNPFTVPTSDFVPSATSAESPGQAVGLVMVIPPAYALSLYDSLGGAGGDPLARTVVVANLRVFGETNGGVDVESDWWSWPIDVCRDACLTACVAVDTTDTATCCTPGQDCVTEVICTP